MSRKKNINDDVPVSFRLPVEVQELLIEKAHAEDLNFSQLVRRALRRELQCVGIPCGCDESKKVAA